MQKLLFVLFLTIPFLTEEEKTFDQEADDIFQYLEGSIAITPQEDLSLKEHMGALGPIEEKKIRAQPQWFETNGVDP